MGVVYKLNNQIKEVIINLKKENPNLSCRSLMSTLKKKFKIRISKSSINAVIKEANLSSPVGRRRKKGPAQRIIKPTPPPEETIKELEDKSQPVDFIQREETKLLPILKSKIAKHLAMQEDKLIKPPPIIEPEELESPQLIEIKEDRIFDNMGGFFLKAAEFEASDMPIIAKMLDRNPEAEFFKKYGFIGDILLYLPLLEIKDLSEISNYKADGLWVLAQQKKPSVDSITRYLRKLEDIRGLSLAIHSKCSQLFQRVNFFKLFLEDDTVFYIDGQFKSIWTEPHKLGCFSTTYYKSMSCINNLFLKNVQSAILLTAPGYNSFSRVLSEFILACEEMPDKRIIKIAVYNDQNKEMHRLLDIPVAKRYFIMGFWPWQKEFIELIKRENRSINSCNVEDIAREIYYNEGQMEFIQHIVNKRVMLRFALLKDSPISPARMGIITNFPSENKPMYEIVQSYLRRWPNLEESYQDFLRKRQGISSSGTIAGELRSQQRSSAESVYTLGASYVTIWENLSYALRELSKYAQKQFFPAAYEYADFSIMKQKFYSLPGRLKRQKDRLNITLLIPENYEFYEDLLYAIKRFNESEIQDNFQAKITFTLPRKALS